MEIPSKPPGKIPSEIPTKKTEKVPAEIPAKGPQNYPWKYPRKYPWKYPSWKYSEDFLENNNMLKKLNKGVTRIFGCMLPVPEGFWMVLVISWGLLDACWMIRYTHNANLQGTEQPRDRGPFITSFGLCRRPSKVQPHAESRMMAKPRSVMAWHAGLSEAFTNNPSDCR